MEFTGKIKDLTVTMQGEYNLTLTTTDKDTVNAGFQELFECEKLTIKIDKYRKKRSLDSNSYAWAIISKIAAHPSIKSDKDSIYELMLQKYGSPYLDENGSTEKISVLSTIDLYSHHIHVKRIGESELQGKLFTHYILLMGSSEYNTLQMSEFIDGIVSDAKELEIETLTPEELDRMKKAWKNA